MEDGLPADPEQPGGSMRIQVAEQEGGLEKEHAGRPHRGRPAKQRQRHLGEHRLNQEEEECIQEDGGAEECGQERNCSGPGSERELLFSESFKGAPQ